jgi:hypothetical protein
MDKLDVGCLAAETGSIIDDLKDDLSLGVIDERHRNSTYNSPIQEGSYRFEPGHDLHEYAIFV